MRESFAALAVLAAILVAESTLAKPPFWDRVIDKPGRFKVLTQLHSSGVLDKETGLVWQRVPGSPHVRWSDANLVCLFLEIGGRGGWRLPAAEELMSLSNFDRDPSLPEDHPFVNADGADREYWTATTSHDTPDQAYGVKFDQSGITQGLKTNEKRTWCVRGGQGVDGGH